MSRLALNQDSLKQKKNFSINSRKIDEYVLLPSEIFLEQFDALSKKSQLILEQKLMLLKINPTRNKRLHGLKFFLFRVRFEDEGKEKRLIYLLDPPYVKILFILERNKDYKDMKPPLKKLGFV